MIVNYLSPAPESEELNRIKFILIPCGTANALYSSLFPPNSCEPTDPTYKLQSLHAYLNTSRIRPISTALNTIHSSAPLSDVLSMVVTSTCMHASILRDSEKLRSEFPSIDRFKIAAQRNSHRWYSGHAKVFPLTGGKPVQIFEPTVGHFVDHPKAERENPIVELDGPFVYFLSVVNVDRLEPTYVIAPSVEQTPDPVGSCKLVVIRPSRDPEFRANDEVGRAAFVAKLWEILTSPYEKGAHIRLRYAEGGMVSADGQGPPVIEYLRCGGWEWYPEQTDEYAHFLCSDGAIYQIPRGGRLAFCMEPARNGIEFAVYA
ncbi:hypothetical protein APHAL10511_001382 [Amanita phalloides]|nr:hypothetical protein APHAL10511_001382 [Amanita phalloides]